MTAVAPVKSWDQHIGFDVSAMAILEHNGMPKHGNLAGGGVADASDKLNFSQAVGLPENFSFKPGPTTDLRAMAGNGAAPMKAAKVRAPTLHG